MESNEGILVCTMGSVESYYPSEDKDLHDAVCQCDFEMIEEDILLFEED